MITAWDGFVRVDYRPETSQLLVTVLTVEPTVFRRLHDGLAAAFAADDRTGPPTFIDLALPAGITEDTEALLGAPLSALASTVIGAQPRSRSGRLDLREVSEVAHTWAPYRAQVVAGDDQQAARTVGRWADQLWSRVADAALRNAFNAPRLTEAHRSPSTAGTGDWHELILPAALAEAAGVRPRIGWTAFDQAGERGFVVRAEQHGDAPPRLLVGIDDGVGAWVPLEPDQGKPGEFIADLPLNASFGEPALRFRTDTEGR
jgi:hypothetical protein